VKHLLFVLALAACAAAPTAPAHRACDSCLVQDRLAADASLALPDSLTTVVVKTYDGANQVVHPDAIAFPVPLHGWRYGLLAMPYPPREGRDQVERPSLWVSNNRRYWTTVTDSTKNPIAAAVRGHILSDNSILYDTALGGLRIYYRENVPNTPDHVLTKTSPDGGLTWSAAREVLAPGPNDGFHEFAYLSPTEVYHRMWYVSAQDGCYSTASLLHERSSVDGEHWGAETTDSLVQPGYVPWHINIVYDAASRQYLGLLAAFHPADGCAATDLFLITSVDGTHWMTYPQPLMRAAYESTFVDHDAQGATILFSRIGPANGVFTLAIQHYAWADLYQRVTQ